VVGGFARLGVSGLHGEAVGGVADSRTPYEFVASAWGVRCECGTIYNLGLFIKLNETLRAAPRGGE
jgi:hypothetical protein